VSPDGRSKTDKIALTWNKVKDALGELHDISLSGHLDINKTLNKVRQWYHWLHMRSNGKGCCQQCGICVSF
jgi:hypothetical protein